MFRNGKKPWGQVGGFPQLHDSLGPRAPEEVEERREDAKSNIQLSLNPLRHCFYEILWMLLRSGLQIKQGGERRTGGKSQNPRVWLWNLHLQEELLSGCAPSAQREVPSSLSTRLGCLPAPGSGILKMKWLSPSRCGNGALMGGGPAPPNYRKPRKARPRGTPRAGSQGDEMGTKAPREISGLTLSQAGSAKPDRCIPQDVNTTVEDRYGETWKLKTE